jgi:hypothetical protein
MDEDADCALRDDLPYRTLQGQSVEHWQHNVSGFAPWHSQLEVDHQSSELWHPHNVTITMRYNVIVLQE